MNSCLLASYVFLKQIQYIFQNFVFAASFQLESLTFVFILFICLALYLFSFYYSLQLLSNFWAPNLKPVLHQSFQVLSSRQYWEYCRFSHGSIQQCYPDPSQEAATFPFPSQAKGSYKLQPRQQVVSVFSYPPSRRGSLFQVLALSSECGT